MAEVCLSLIRSHHFRALRNKRRRLHIWFALIVVIMAFAPQLTVCASSLEDLGGVTSVKALTAVMYRDMTGWGGAYKLLNATSRIGSQGPDDAMAYVDAPLVAYSSLQSPPYRSAVVLLPVKLASEFFTRWLDDAALQAAVQGVLVDDTEVPNAYSSVGQFPGAEYAPYPDPGHVWNPAASAALASAFTWFPAPVMLLRAQMADDARQRALYNSHGDASKQQYHARIKLTMTNPAASNSSACIAARTCKPLGGYSVWSALPPVPHPQASGSAGGRPIILVTAQMDSIDMFHDAVQGANAPLSGLVALLSALQVLKAAGVGSSYSRRLVFLALAGEPWGYMGSRRLLFEASVGSNATAGLDLHMVEKVIEVGQVGVLPSSGPGPAGRLRLFAHSQRGGAFGDAADIVSVLTAAAQQEASAAQVDIQQASSSNPGIPPSSLMSFLRVNASIQGAVLAEYDTAFTNAFFASRFDNGSRISNSSIASTAAVLAGALHRLAGGDPAQLQVDMAHLTAIVQDFMSCIILPTPGFSCPLAASMMTADYEYSAADNSRSYAPKNYVGVLQYMPDLQQPLGKANLARFLWNNMALATSSGPAGAACDPYDSPCSNGQVCVGWRASGGDPSLMGKCMAATVRYVPSYSTQLRCEACDDPWRATWHQTSEADAWNQQYNWPADPVWAESDWPTGIPDLQLYLHEAPAVEHAVLAAGFVVTAVVGALSYAARSVFVKHQVAWSQT